MFHVSQFHFYSISTVCIINFLWYDVVGWVFCFCLFLSWIVGQRDYREEEAQYHWDVMGLVGLGLNGFDILGWVTGLF